MPCTTILVGKNASYDGSTLMARNEDSCAGDFQPKKFIVVQPEEQPKHYKAVLSKFEIDLPENPMRYTAVPNADPARGVWGEVGYNELNICMSETETLTSNARVLGADPLVEEGIGEEDMLTLVLPYIHSAREGVTYLGAILEKYGTYEMNGIGFQDTDEIWWLETIGGHHWIAKKVPDDCYVVMPNQQGIDWFDLSDAYGDQKEHMCSADLITWIRGNHLDVSRSDEPLETRTDLNVRVIFGSRSDADHVYNTPRAWFMERYLNPNTFKWDGPDADFGPEADDIPWCLVPENLVTIEDIKYVLSSYYQGTIYNPYDKRGDLYRGMYRPIGINRNNFVAVTQLRPYMPEEIRAVMWMAFGCNAFNGMVPFYGNINAVPAYLSETTRQATTENFYWANRYIAAMADSHFGSTMADIERYSLKTLSVGHKMLDDFDKEYLKLISEMESVCDVEESVDVPAYLEDCNQKIADWLKKETYDLLYKVLFTSSNEMKNAFARSDN